MGSKANYVQRFTKGQRVLVGGTPASALIPRNSRHRARYHQLAKPLEPSSQSHTEEHSLRSHSMP